MNTNAKMQEMIVSRQNKGETTTFRDLSKRFKLGIGDIFIALQESGNISFGDENYNGKTEVTVTEAEPVSEELLEGIENHIDPTEEVSEIEEPVTEEVSEEPVTESDAQLYELTETEKEMIAGIEKHVAEAKARKEAKPANRKIDFSTYRCYASVEDAEAALGYALIKISELGKMCESLNVPVGRLVKAFGGDRMKFQPRSTEWTPIMVGRTRYVAASCQNELENL